MNQAVSEPVASETSFASLTHVIVALLAGAGGLALDRIALKSKFAMIIMILLYSLCSPGYKSLIRDTSVSHVHLKLKQ